MGHDLYGIGGFADMQIECLHRTICALDTECRLAGNSLPRTLFLQLDNASDNKNRFMMAYIEYLENCNVFDNIEVGFLVVGHP